MRRDLCYFYPCPLDSVYSAFLQAANEKYGKDCKTDPGKSITFGLNFSFKYNMNGGALTVHVMPHQGGTAVDLRYSIVQAMGARYKAHARDLLKYVEGLIGTPAQDCALKIDAFLAYEESGTAPGADPVLTAEQAEKPQILEEPEQIREEAVRQPEVRSEPAEERTADPGTCPFCGRKLPLAGKFCPYCGGKLKAAPVKVFCVNCGAPMEKDARFCANCGTQRK